MNITPLTDRDLVTVSSSSAAVPAPLRLSDPNSKIIAGALVALLAIVVTVGLWVPHGPKLAIMLLAMAAFAILTGYGIVQRWFGILINDKNVMSLARFQLVLWTIVILSSYLCYALARVAAGTPDPLKIDFDEQLLLMMGISAGSFLTAPMVLSTKKDKEPDPLAVAKTAAKTGEPTQLVDANRDGTLYANNSPADARFTDIFQGDEVGNATHVDVAKLQMFFFTVGAVIAYAAAVYSKLEAFQPGAAVAAGKTAETLATLPALPAGLTIALGVSHAGYLTSKGVDHTPTT